MEVIKRVMKLTNLTIPVIEYVVILALLN